jgi:uncharacterized protein (TIGR03083 family)
MQPTTKAQVLERIRAERSAFDALLAGVSDERLARPGVSGGWSIKDILAHVVWWELRTLEKLNREVTPLEQPGEDHEAAIQRVNQAVYEEHWDQPSAAIRAAFPASLMRLVEGLEGYTESFVLAHEQDIAMDSYDHYPEHVEAIRTLLGVG